MLMTKMSGILYGLNNISTRTYVEILIGGHPPDDPSSRSALGEYYSPTGWPLLVPASLFWRNVIINKP